MQGYTQREVENAKKAREFYTMCMKPTVRNLKHLVNGNFVKNCPVTINDINVAEKIFGPDIGTLKGKSVRQRPPVVWQDNIEVPEEILRLDEEIILYIDNIFINGLPFLSHTRRKDQVRKNSPTKKPIDIRTIRGTRRSPTAVQWTRVYGEGDPLRSGV